MINSQKIGPNRIRPSPALNFVPSAIAQLRAARRAVLLAALLGPPVGLRLARAGTAAHALATHALAMHGEPEWGPNFSNPTYANPAAPKGGQLVQGVLGTFDCLNPFIVK